MFARATSLLFPVAVIAWIVVQWRRSRGDKGKKGKGRPSSRKKLLERDSISGTLPRNKLSRNRNSKKRNQSKKQNKNESTKEESASSRQSSPTETDMTLHFVHSHLKSRPRN